MTTKLGLVYGGKSAEHQVSLQTAKAVINALDFGQYEVHPIYITVTGRWIRGQELTSTIEEASILKFEEGKEISPTSLNQSVFPSNESEERPFDIIFPLLHGPNGEDGTVQGLLELLDIPYVGNGVLASSAGMDKVMMKNIYAHAGIRQPAYVWYTRPNFERDTEAACQHVEEVLGFPCFVKPANLGSSVGISKASNQEELNQAFQTAFDYDRKVIVEEGIDGREVEIAVLGNDEPECSVVGEIVPKADFYDYKAKYEDNSTGLIIPAEITDEEYETIRAVAVQSFKALDCSGLVRADFFLTKDSTVLMNEVNTMPGFTPVSMFPLLWQESGISYPELIEKMIRLGMERYEEKKRIKHTF